MDDTDAVNLLAHIFFSSYRAYKRPVATETQREASRALHAGHITTEVAVNDEGYSTKFPVTHLFV